MPELTGTVFNIQRFTVHDGPGIRTEIFLKGCPLRCRWCSNPESFVTAQQVGVYGTKCVGIDKCGACVAACPSGALLALEGKIAAIDRAACTSCLRCQDACPSDALKLWGQRMTVDEVLAVIEKDRGYYARSGGGVTLSGGEALLQAEFVLEVLRRCGAAGIHTCVESALHIRPEVLQVAIAVTDLFITDIKQMDSRLHQQYTGVGNEQILENIRTLAASGKPMILRLPIIPGVNDTEAHVASVGDFIAQELNGRVLQVQFLRFRRLGEEKYQSLGLPYHMTDVDPEREHFEEHIRALAHSMQQRGIPAVTGTTHKLQHTNAE